MAAQVNKLILEVLELINNDNYIEAGSQAFKILSDDEICNSLSLIEWEYLASISLEIEKYEIAKKCYLISQVKDGIAFILILQGKLNEATEVLNICEDSSFKLWLYFLIKLFTYGEKINLYPQFFMIRNYLEFTFYHLLKINNKNYIDLLLINLNKFNDVNLDSEKYIGCAYLHHSNADQAIQHFEHLLLTSKYDYELYFYLAQAFLSKKDYFNAVSMLECSQALMSDHFPTADLLEKVKLIIDEK